MAPRVVLDMQQLLRPCQLLLLPPLLFLSLSLHSLLFRPLSGLTLHILPGDQGQSDHFHLAAETAELQRQQVS